MSRARAGLAVLTAMGTAACATNPWPSAPGWETRPPASTVRASLPPLVLPPSPLTEAQRILHVLDRLGYGPRPGDVERVRRMGLSEYMARQLDPASISDAAVERALLAYPALAMSTPDLVRAYTHTPGSRDGAEPAVGSMGPDQPGRTVERRPAMVTTEMQAAKMLRAVLSERQLLEVMVDFWFNHFNVFAREGPVRWALPAYERDAIRPHALGRFRNLLLATARHPAMLFYLDNWMSTRADYTAAPGALPGRKRGLNENYARELLELHTLGVDGGYSEEDVVEVARCFTGWTIDRPRQGGGFVFIAEAHDQDPKRVLGHRIPAGGGIADGEQVIAILAAHPSTARFIATKLARRFVSDEPPPALLARVAGTFRDTDGDIAVVLASLFTSPEFFSVDAHRAKIKTPLELVASAARALGVRRLGPPDEPAGGADGAARLALQVSRMGAPPYLSAAPTGYPDRAEAWINTGALLHRVNFALALALGRVPGVRPEFDAVAAGARQPDTLVDWLVGELLGERARPETRLRLAGALRRPRAGESGGADDALTDIEIMTLAGLVLGSPEFQRR